MSIGGSLFTVAGCALGLALAAGLGSQSKVQNAKSAEQLAASMEQKLARVTQNANHHRPLTTVLSQEEINAYFALRMGSRIPKGVYDVRFELDPGRPAAFGTVDFDEYKAAAKRPVNPVLDLLLQGRKAVAVRAAYESPSKGYGLFHLESVTIGTFTVRGALLDFLLRWFVLPRYPNAAVDRPFPLPANIQKGAVEEGRVVLYQ